MSYAPSPGTPMRTTVAALAISLSFTLGSCMTYRHSVGKGAQAHVVVSEQAQWWILWGLVPISPSPPVDGGGLAQGRPDYTIQTRYDAIDSVISILLFPVLGIQKQTVTVER